MIDPAGAAEVELISNSDPDVAAIFDKVKDHVQANLLRIRIYYDSKSVQSIVESPQYPQSSIVSNIGGVISLYLGISLVSIFELVDYIAHLIYYGFRKKKAWHETRQQKAWTLSN